MGKVMNFTDDERMAYEDRLKWLMVESNTLRKYEEKGFERGLEKGREEEKVEIAKNMLAKGLDLETISSVTQLSLEKIKT